MQSLYTSIFSTAHMRWQLLYKLATAWFAQAQVTHIHMIYARMIYAGMIYAFMIYAGMIYARMSYARTIFSRNDLRHARFSHAWHKQVLDLCAKIDKIFLISYQPTARLAGPRLSGV